MVLTRYPPLSSRYCSFWSFRIKSLYLIQLPLLGQQLWLELHDEDVNREKKKKSSDNQLSNR